MPLPGAGTPGREGRGLAGPPRWSRPVWPGWVRTQVQVQVQGTWSCLHLFPSQQLELEVSQSQGSNRQTNHLAGDSALPGPGPDPSAPARGPGVQPLRSLTLGFCSWEVAAAVCMPPTLQASGRHRGGLHGESVQQHPLHHVFAVCPVVSGRLTLLSIRESWIPTGCLPRAGPAFGEVDKGCCCTRAQVPDQRRREGWARRTSGASQKDLTSAPGRGGARDSTPPPCPSPACPPQSGASRG